MIRYSPDGKFTVWHFPGADLDYGFNWFKKGYLEAGETVTDSEWSVPDDVVMSRNIVSDDGHVTAAFFTTDVLGEHVITNTIMTSGGRRDSRTITLICKQW